MTEIVVYSQPQCPTCDFLKMFFKEHGISYIEKNIKMDSKARDELINKYNSFSTPTTIIDGKVITGFQLEELKEALNLKEI